MSTDALPLPEADSLPDDVALLKQLVIQLIQQVRTDRQEKESLEHRIDLLLRRLYGRSSEKLDPRQGTLFDTAVAEAGATETASETPAAEDSPPEAAGDAPPKKKRKGHGRRPKPDHLEVREKVYDLSEAEKKLLAGDGQLVFIGEEVSEHYDYEPSCLYLVRSIQKKYARRPQLLESGAGARRKTSSWAPSRPCPSPAATPVPDCWPT